MATTPIRHLDYKIINARKYDISRKKPMYKYKKAAYFMQVGGLCATEYSKAYKPKRRAASGPKFDGLSFPVFKV